MIKKISIQNFKSLKKVNLECGNLNLLTGLNGMGKSSAIQAMLLLRQSYQQGYLNKGLSLNGSLTNIGVGKDAFYEYAERGEPITFSLAFANDETIEEKTWNFGYEETSDPDINPSEMDSLVYIEDTDIPNDLSHFSLFNNRFQYLNAERWVRDQYLRSDIEVVKNRNIGKHGEYAPHFLVHYGNKTEENINDARAYPGIESKTLSDQVSAWMQEISPGVQVNPERITGINAVKLGFKFTTTTGKTRDYTATNVGFGITYVLPVVTALLSAKPGDILLIENPESHIHPKGQSAIGRLITITAGLGVQIFIETHSDHVINGICVAVYQGFLSNDLTKVHFFEKEDTQTIGHEIEIMPNGRINKKNKKENNIKGFFDQFEIDLEKLLFSKP